MLLLNTLTLHVFAHVYVSYMYISIIEMGRAKSDVAARSMPAHNQKYHAYATPCVETQRVAGATVHTSGGFCCFVSLRFYLCFTEDQSQR